MLVFVGQRRKFYERRGIMEGIREYLLSVSYAALICTIIVMLAGEKSSAGKSIKILAGIFLIMVILKPAIQIRISDWKSFESDFWETSQQAVAEGERLALASFSAKATLSTQRLIEQEAERLGCRLDVVVVWEDNSPKEIQLKGAVSPYAKSAITRWITNNMDLSGEAVIWIG